METARPLLLALVALALLLGGFAFFVSRTTDTPHVAAAPTRLAPVAPAPAPAPTPPPSAVDDPRLVAQSSARLMPPGYVGLHLGMPLDELRRLRPAARRDPRSETRNDGRELWEERGETGARVLFLVSSRNGALAQAQFASRLDNIEGLGPHLEALRATYGSPTGVWDCPESADAPPLRRFTWRSEGASLMEAVLVYNGTVALTLIVGRNADIADALQRSRCEPVRSPAQLERFPTATALRGERSPSVREVPPPPH